MLKVNKGMKAFIFDAHGVNPRMIVDPNFYKSTETEGTSQSSKKKYYKS